MLDRLSIARLGVLSMGQHFELSSLSRSPCPYPYTSSSSCYPPPLESSSLRRLTFRLVFHGFTSSSLIHSLRHLHHTILSFIQDHEPSSTSTLTLFTHLGRLLTISFVPCRFTFRICDYRCIICIAPLVTFVTSVVSTRQQPLPININIQHSTFKHC